MRKSILVSYAWMLFVSILDGVEIYAAVPHKSAAWMFIFHIPLILGFAYFFGHMDGARKKIDQDMQLLEEMHKELGDKMDAIIRMRFSYLGNGKEIKN
jgi:hypothetical protein